MTPIVTQITAQAASAETLTDADYRDIYTELRSKCPLRKFADLIGSTVTHAWWNKYEHGEARLSYERRCELRRAVGLPDLPLPVTQALAPVTADATVYQVGAGRPDRVVLVGQEAHAPLTLRLNGALQILPAAPALIAHVTGVTRPRSARSYKSLAIRRATWERLNARRLAAGQTWDEFITRLEAGA